jgi:hypothetical protein
LLQVRLLLRLPRLLRLIFVLVSRGTAGPFLFVFGSAARGATCRRPVSSSVFCGASGTAGHVLPLPLFVFSPARSATCRRPVSSSSCWRRMARPATSSSSSARRRRAPPSPPLLCAPPQKLPRTRSCRRQGAARSCRRQGATGKELPPARAAGKELQVEYKCTLLKKYEEAQSMAGGWCTLPRDELRGWQCLPAILG